MYKKNITLESFIVAIMNSIANAQRKINKEALNGIDDMLEVNYGAWCIKNVMPSNLQQDAKHRENEVLMKRFVKATRPLLKQSKFTKVKKIVTKFNVLLGDIYITNAINDGAGNTLIKPEVISNLQELISINPPQNIANKKCQAELEIVYQRYGQSKVFLSINNERLNLTAIV